MNSQWQAGYDQGTYDATKPVVEERKREFALQMAIQFYDGRLSSTNPSGVVDAATRFLAFLNDEVEES